MLNAELKSRNLPDILTFSNGERVTDVASWEKRRSEILEELQNEMYGRLPEKPKSIKFEEISNDDFFCAGKGLHYFSRTDWLYYLKYYLD